MVQASSARAQRVAQQSLQRMPGELAVAADAAGQAAAISFATPITYLANWTTHNDFIAQLGKYENSKITRL